MPPIMKDGLVYIQPGVAVTVEVANAQFQFLSDMAPYLNQATGLDQKEEFLLELYRVFFERWPNLEKPGEDYAHTENRMALTRKRIRSDLVWRRFTKGVAQGTWRRRLLEEEQKIFALQFEELLEGDGAIVKPLKVKRTRDDEYSTRRPDPRLLTRPKKRSRRIIGFIDLTNDSDGDSLDNSASVENNAGSSGISDQAPVDLFGDGDDGVSEAAAAGYGAMGDGDLGGVYTQAEDTSVAVVENVATCM